ncbi:6-phosphogluconolactonase [Yinghuangia soli]|uniref:6-phosphogluconolactonase n=1 Tax=Yinghuangia soli TaxID=2908204 RepID=A0AA41U2B4_9ACTN|nr:6-phosphogluconolactonase [Yinghuangia soli]MCF2530521.1 6-phosphogluconolactonase [Yinghuangia soli]
MTGTPGVLIHADGTLLARAAAARLITRLVDAQAARGIAHVVLTGGRNGNALMRELAESPARDAVDWAHVHVWWGDERFLPAGDPERNETQARAELLDKLPLNPAYVHPMPASDGPDGNDPEAAAARYAEELAAAAKVETAGERGGVDVPSFDVAMFGVGPDTHVASLFPELPAVHETERTVVAVRGAPKPPPTRITLTFPAIRTAKDVWLLAAGEDKAAAVRIALAGSGDKQVPAAGAYGRRNTLWLLDRSAAAELPPGLNRIASP